MQVLVDDSLKKYIGSRVTISKYLNELGLKPTKLIEDANFGVLSSDDDGDCKLMIERNNLVAVYRGNLDELDKATLYNQYRCNKLAYPLKQYSIMDVNDMNKKYDMDDIYAAHEESMIAILSYFDLVKKLTEKYVKEYRDLSEYDTVWSNYYNYIDYHLHSIFNIVENSILFEEEGITETLLHSLDLGNEYYYDLLNIVCGYYFDYNGEESVMDKKANRILTKARI